MREIKFRAWDKDRKLMYYNVGFSGSNSFPRRIMDGDIDCLKLVTFDTAELMQFTGLQDKNGVDIYEGDIKLWKFNNHAWCYECYWSDIDSGFRWKMISHNEKQKDDLDMLFETEEDYYNYVINSNQRNMGFDCYSTIIGNIHQNKDLLK